MNAGNELLAAIDANPHDWALRLVYADWLEEHGLPRLAAYERQFVKYERLGVESLEKKRTKQIANYGRRPRHTSWKDERRRQYRGK